jgi:hypothetical protein
MDQELEDVPDTESPYKDDRFNAYCKEWMK